jgi:hypothetical protein
VKYYIKFVKSVPTKDGNIYIKKGACKLSSTDK